LNSSLLFCEGLAFIYCFKRS